MATYEGRILNSGFCNRNDSRSSIFSEQPDYSELHERVDELQEQRKEIEDNLEESEMKLEELRKNNELLKDFLGLTD